MLITQSRQLGIETGCNPPVVSLENEITVDEGVKGVILDASGRCFDSKDGKSLAYEWSQIAGIKREPV